MTGWDAFNKYCGIQGILGLLLVGGYVGATLTGVTLPETYYNLTFGVVGYYFAKNGVGIIDALKAPARKVR